jgi:hypothetical protein
LPRKKDEGFVPAGDEAQAILYEPNQAEEQDLMDALRNVSGRYDITDFDLPRLKAAIGHDVKLLKKILDCVKPITPEQDAKLQELKKRLARKPLKDGKRLIFTQYADTARYLERETSKGFQQLFLLDANGAVVSKDIPRILGAIKCGPELNGQPLPRDYNAAVLRVQRQFAEEVKHRQAERMHTLSLSHGQNYVLRELRVLFAASADEDQKAMINVLEKSFRGPITRAVNREVILLRRNGVSGEPLQKALARIYDQHNLREWVDRRSLHATGRPVPRIVCSEALV